MKSNSYSIILCLIVLIIPASYSYQACSSYKPNFEADCSSLSDKTKTCIYYNKQCICNKIQCSDLDTKYKCENYYIGQSFNEICVYDNERGCFMQNKLCSNWSALYGRDYCEKFRASRPRFHVCRYNNGQCFENLGICSDTLMPYSDETDTRLRCETIIPNEDNYKCLLDSNEVNIAEKLKFVLLLLLKNNVNLRFYQKDLEGINVSLKMVHARQ